MNTKNKLPGKDTQGYQLLELIAICGEFPANLLSRLPGSTSYKETVVWSLKKEKLLRTYYRDKLRGYRLGRLAKALLLKEQPKRFSFYLTGNTDTNLLKSEFSRRFRLHRMAEIYVLMQNAGVSVFRDEKPQVFAPDGSPVSRIEAPAFYNSREIKELGIEMVKIRGSRAIGALLALSGIFLIYNSGSDTSKWDYRSEQKAKVLLEIILCRQRLSSQYARTQIQGVLFGNGMEPFYQILVSADSQTRCFFLLDGNYEHFYYLTHDRYGEALLKLLCDPDRILALNRILSEGLSPKNCGSLIENDAIDSEGNPVLFGYFLDIPRISRFLSGLQLQNRSGTLVCFDFQMDMLSRLCGEYVRLSSISFEKFERRFFHK